MGVPLTARPSSTLFKPEKVAVSYCKNIAVVVWHARADGDSTPAVLDFVDRLLLDYQQFSVAHVVQDNVGLPTTEARDVLLDRGRKGKDKLACAGVLLPQSSIIATTLRAFARTSRMLLGNHMSLVVEQDARALAQVMCEVHAARTRVRVTPEELTRSIEALRNMK